MMMRRCIDKVVMEEMVEWENVVTCDHSYNKRCHTSQITTFNAAQVVYLDSNQCWGFGSGTGSACFWASRIRIRIRIRIH
jgi:hypothetical protein